MWWQQVIPVPKMNSDCGYSPEILQNWSALSPQNLQLDLCPEQKSLPLHSIHSFLS